MLPPDWMTATRLPAMRSFSCSSAARAAAPAPSARLCVSVKRWRIAARISASVTLTMRSAPSRIRPSASGSGTRQATPSASVSAELVETGFLAVNAPAYALSFAARKPVSTNSADTLADGVACRVPDPDALGLILEGADRIVSVTEAEIRAAMRHLFTDTHNLAEGAGAAALAALLQEKERMAGKRVAVIQSGGNIDRELYLSVLAE